MKDTDLAWAAGFFDGEGCISCSKPWYSLVVSASQNEIEPLRKLQNLFGGKITVKGKVNIHYHWYIRGEEALKFLSLVVPFLIVKKLQALVGIQLRAYGGFTKEHQADKLGIPKETLEFRVACYNELKRLKSVTRVSQAI